MDTYLSDSIVLKEGKTYHEDKLVKKHNWHIKLEELGWSKLSPHWISKLNKVYTPYKNNSLFGTLDCGSDGDCLFHCIANALNSTQKNFYDSSDIRAMVAESISEETFNDIITCYRAMKELDDFEESWDPSEVETLDDFKEIIKETGHSYWGDHFMIQMISQAFSLNIIILQQDEVSNVYELYSLSQDYDEGMNTVILLHVNDNHFQLVGYFQDLMVTYFTNDTLPPSIREMVKIK